jgi:hypothetical protein
MEMESTQERRSGSSKVVVIIALLLLVAADVFLLYQLFNKNDEIKGQAVQIKSLNHTKDSLIVEINTLQQQIDDLKKQLQQSGDASVEKEAEIAKLQAQLNNAKRAVYSGDPKMMAMAKKEMEKAVQLKKQYESEVIAAREERDAEKLKNQSLLDSLNAERQNGDKLKKDKGLLSKKIKEGSALKADAVGANPIQVKKSGKEVVTAKAKRVSKVKVCFKLQQNLVTEAGPKTIYMRVLGPERSVITSNANETFNFDGDKLSYTERKEVQYDNKDTDVCISWKKGGTEYAKGNYTVELYESGVQIGKGSFLLK